MTKLIYVLCLLFFAGGLSAQTALGALRVELLVEGEAAMQANVLLRPRGEETFTKWAYTDMEGLAYFPSLQAGEYELKISYVGIETQKRRIFIKAGKLREIKIESEDGVWLIGDEKQAAWHVVFGRQVEGVCGRINNQPPPCVLHHLHRLLFPENKGIVVSARSRPRWVKWTALGLLPALVGVHTVSRPDLEQNKNREDRGTQAAE